MPRRCPLRPVCPLALRDTPSCVRRRLPRSGEKLPGTAKQGLGGWQIPTQNCIVLFNLIQCEDWLVVRQWSKDMSLSFSHLISVFKMFSLDTVLAVVTVYKTEENTKARLVVSSGPWVWVQPSVLGAPRPAWDTPAQPHPPLSGVHVQTGRRPVTLRMARQSCCSDCSRLVSPGQGARACVLSMRISGGRRVNGTTSKRRWCRLHF